jgi:hypothetical protein
MLSDFNAGEVGHDVGIDNYDIIELDSNDNLGGSTDLETQSIEDDGDDIKGDDIIDKDSNDNLGGTTELRETSMLLRLMTAMTTWAVQGLLKF